MTSTTNSSWDLSVEPMVPLDFPSTGRFERGRQRGAINALRPAAQKSCDAANQSIRFRDRGEEWICSKRKDILVYLYY